jgi:hypothetical protein
VKTFYALDLAATMICSGHRLLSNISSRIIESSGSDSKESVIQWLNITKAQMTINEIQSGI